MEYEAIVWDFNGTLIDDLPIAVEAMNRLLSAREMPLTSEKEYRNGIQIPVQGYYESLFGAACDMAVLTEEFLTWYRVLLPNVGLAAGALAALERFQAQNVQQFILSSFEENFLLEIVEHLKVRSFFVEVSGAVGNHSPSKVGRASELLLRHGLVPSKTLVIGDMVHDFQVAEALGAHCLLVYGGHQRTKDLHATGARVVESLQALDW